MSDPYGAFQKAGKRFFSSLQKNSLKKITLMCFLLFFPCGHSFFTFLNSPRSVNRYPFCARWAFNALLYPALLTGGGRTSWDISAMNARTAAYAIAVVHRMNGIILSKYSSSDSVSMNGIKELSGKKVIGYRISPRCISGLPFCCWPPGFKFADVNLSAMFSVANLTSLTFRRMAGSITVVVFTQPGNDL
jgi:hypothetical protein